MELTLKDFEIETKEFEVRMTVSNKFLELLRKSGYDKNTETENDKQSLQILRTNKAKCIIWSNQINIFFDEDEINNKVGFIKIINHRLTWLEKNKELIDKSLISSKLIPLKNSTWLEENENPITEEEFIQKTGLKSVSFYPDNSFELEFNDGMMFGGHDISLMISSEMKIDEPTI